MSFYVILPYDSSRSVFPDNKVGKFTTMLAREVVLEGKYEVGLSELVMPVAQRLTSSQQMIAYTEADFLLKAWTVDMRKVTIAEDIHIGVDKKPVFRFSVKNKKSHRDVRSTWRISLRLSLRVSSDCLSSFTMKASLESLTRRRFHSIRLKSFFLV